MKLKSIIIFAILILSLITARADAQSLTWLGTLGGTYSSASAVSDDGIIAGEAANLDEQSRATRWIRPDNIQDLGTLGGVSSDAQDISSDGSVIVGSSGAAVGDGGAFRWTYNDGMQYLGTFRAEGVSSNGSVVVGRAFSPSRAIVWTEASGMQELPSLGGFGSEAFDVNNNGSAIVGYSALSNGYPRATLWSGGAAIDLGTLNGYVLSYAHGVSPEGSIVVGHVHNSFGIDHAFLWNGSMVDLNPSVGVWSQAKSVSSGGSVVVGAAGNSVGVFAFRWTGSTGFEDLNIVYANLLSNGSNLMIAEDVSSDGRYIVGYGYNAISGQYEGFLLDTQDPTNVISEQYISNTFQLFQCYPNPFNPFTTIQYSIPQRNNVILKVYDILGNEVATLVNEEKPAGTYEVEFKSHSDGGQNLPSGVYFYRIAIHSDKLSAGSFTETKKMTLIK